MAAIRSLGQAYRDKSEGIIIFDTVSYSHHDFVRILLGRTVLKLDIRITGFNYLIQIWRTHARNS